MDPSRYFERTLFYDRSPVANEYYERSSDRIFERNPESSRVEVWVQTSKHVSQYDKTNEELGEKIDGKVKKEGVATKHLAEISSHQLNVDSKSSAVAPRYSSDGDDTWSVSSRASSTALPAAPDQHQRGSCPPLYPGPPKLANVDLNLRYLRAFIKDTKSDFRVFYLRQIHSYSRVQITKQLFEQLLEGCHVFPKFNEYLIGFGNKTSEAEVGPPPLKFRPLCDSHSNRYNGFECSYILRYVEFTNRGGGKSPWSLRQFAVYHRYKTNIANPCSTWILVGASQRTELELDRYTRSIETLLGSNPFELHVIFLDTAIDSWREYLGHLTQQVTYQIKHSVS
ncbi:hypothetical protein K491DRAFT_357870 [Lophiostoma macrostomum CBS 122681]|uniref:CorA-like transporter domain-containing protein n=1 Tax=Lophiostoma macrostomum CBS 122681 TaxID=1314788 RepID=A0A6A6TAD1_9PLEO|nr:hypothetical protein K491DRAFT_357870 [Lophiostoma macrostomum CBS 122681]